MGRTWMRCGAAAITILLMGFQSPPILPPEIVRLMDDAEAARGFDYYGLKARGIDPTALNTQAEAWLRRRTGASPEGRGGRCVTEAEQAVVMGLKTAGDAADGASWRSDRTEADRAVAVWRDLGRRILAGDPVADPPFNAVAERVAGVGRASDSRTRELLQRVAEDQFLRNTDPDDPRQTWAAGLTAGAKTRVWRIIGAETCRHDSANAVWLDDQVARSGWFDIPTHGEQADTAAWLIAQHADRDPTFQRRILDILEPLTNGDRTSPSNYAYLYDRVAVNTGRPQRYGTQGRCTARDVWTPRDIAEEQEVDLRRIAVGIGILADYKADMNRRCSRFEG